MVPFASKALFGMAFATMVAAIAYGVATDDGSGAAVLGFMAVGAFALALTVTLADADLPPYIAADAPVEDIAPAGGRPALPSPWPLVGAVALGVLALGAATDAVVVVTAAVLLTIAGLGWLFQHWSEHPTYTARYGVRLKERFLVPVGLPLAVFALVAVIAISLSRIFLALPEQGTRAVALAVAVLILAGAFVVAATERMARTALALLCAFAFLAVVGAGVAGLVAGERTFEKVDATAQSGDQKGMPTTGPSSGGSTANTTPTGAATTGGNSAQSGVQGGVTNGSSSVNPTSAQGGSTTATMPSGSVAGAGPNGSGSGATNPSPSPNP